MTIPATAAWRVGDNKLGATRPGTVDTAKAVPLGTVRKFYDTTYGEGEFIYLAGVTSTVAGDLVSYNTTSFTTTGAAAGAGIPWALAVATAATDATTEWGWYQISGLAIANKTKTVSFAAGIAIGVSTAALVIHSSSLKELHGAWVAIVASATTTTNNGGKIVLNLSRPHLQGRIT
jgi:hypothetical protein